MSLLYNTIGSNTRTFDRTDSSSPWSHVAEDVSVDADFKRNAGTYHVVCDSADADDTDGKVGVYRDRIFAPVGLSALAFSRSTLSLVILFGTACRPSTGVDSGDGGGDGFTQDGVLVPRVGYETSVPVSIQVVGGRGDTVDKQTGEVVEVGRPLFSALVWPMPVSMPRVGYKDGDECWSYSIIAPYGYDWLGPTLPVSIGSTEVVLEEVWEGLYITQTDGQVADAIEQQGGKLGFGGAVPGIEFPGDFELHDRAEVWPGMAEEGVVTVHWTPADGGPLSYVWVGGSGYEELELEDEESFACFLVDDGEAVIDLGRPRPDIMLSVGRSQTVIFGSSHGAVLGTLTDLETFPRE